jgi:hypothetical protein
MRGTMGRVLTCTSPVRPMPFVVPDLCWIKGPVFPAPTLTITGDETRAGVSRGHSSVAGRRQSRS